jgi:hypothetical protein
VFKSSAVPPESAANRENFMLRTFSAGVVACSLFFSPSLAWADTPAEDAQTPAQTEAAASAVKTTTPAVGLGRATVIFSLDRVLNLVTYEEITATQNFSSGQFSTSVKSTSKKTSVGLMTYGANASIYTNPRLALDFVAYRLTFGGSAWIWTEVSSSIESSTTTSSVSSPSQDQPKTTYWGVAPRIGYLIPAGDILVFWPRAGIEYHAVASSTVLVNNGATGGSSVNLLAADLEANLVFTPWQHFGFVLNWFSAIPITGSTQVRDAPSVDASDLSIGLSVGLLGYF